MTKLGTGSDGGREGVIFRLSVGMFFIGGFLTSLVSLLVPRLTLVAGQDYWRALLVPLAFYSSYLIFAAPVAMIVARIGYMLALATGLAVMAVACASLLLAQAWQAYLPTLAALLALSAGMTFLQIASNTVVLLTGAPERAASRLTLLQGVNSVGTVAGPLAGAWFLLGGSPEADAPWAIAPPFLFASLLLTLLAASFARRRALLPRAPARTAGPTAWLPLLRAPRVMAGVGAIFAYVGAEVTIGTLLTNYLVRGDVLATDPVNAARLVSLYWGCAMVGRFAGAGLLARVSPSRVLTLAGMGAIALVAVALGARGVTGAIALIGVGLFHSIMFPTIFTLALPRDEPRATPASMLFCMAVVGGAAVPMLAGLVADRAGVALSLAVPAVCYLVIIAFARSAGRENKAVSSSAAGE